LRQGDDRQAFWGTFWFQSHAGSIEARLITLEEAAQRRFNPTLVRLRPGMLMLGPLLNLRFNPTLVRLRPLRALRGARDAEEFQSHAGSIEAVPSLRAMARVALVSIPRWFD